MEKIIINETKTKIKNETIEIYKSNAVGKRREREGREEESTVTANEQKQTTTTRRTNKGNIKKIFNNKN